MKLETAGILLVRRFAPRRFGSPVLALGLELEVGEARDVVVGVPPAVVDEAVLLILQEHALDPLATLLDDDPRGGYESVQNREEEIEVSGNWWSVSPNWTHFRSSDFTSVSMRGDEATSH